MNQIHKEIAKIIRKRRELTKKYNYNKNDFALVNSISNSYVKDFINLFEKRGIIGGGIFEKQTFDKQEFKKRCRIKE